MKQFRIVKRKRLREIEFGRLERVKKRMELGWEEMQLLLTISASQRKRYQACGRMPATRYYALKDALLLDVEQRAREERERLHALFEMDDNDDVMDKQ